MREVRVLCGLAAIAAAVGCSKSSDQEAKSPSGTPQEGANPQTATEEPSAPPADTSAMGQPGAPAQNEPPSAYDQQQQQQQQQAQQAGAQDLVMGTFACLLGPVLNHDVARGGGPQGSSTTKDDYGKTKFRIPAARTKVHPGRPVAQGTAAAGRRAQVPTPIAAPALPKKPNVQPTAVYKAEPAAIDSVRRVIDSRLSGEGVSSDVSNNTLAFFDKGVAAAKEARSAEEAFSKMSAAKAASPHTSPHTSKPTTTPKTGTANEPDWRRRPPWVRPR